MQQERSDTHPRPDSGSGLLCRAQNGDRAAFDLLQRELLPRVLRFARRLLGIASEAAAQDVTRDAFLALYLNLSRLDGENALLPFLFRVVRNRSYDLLRQQGRFETVSLDLTDNRPAVASHLAPPDPEQIVTRMQAWSQVQEAIDHLPEVQRQTLLLFSEEDLTYAEIAGVMGVEVGTVRSRLFHARRNLVRHLRPDTLDTLGLSPAAPDAAPSSSKGTRNT